MIIEMASVGTSPRSIEVAFDPADIDLEGEIISLTGPASFKGEVERAGSRVHLRGVLAADVVLDCTRCLEQVRIHLDEPFKDVFVDAADETDAPEVEVGDVDLDESLIEGGMIDLAEVVREQILLAMPIQVFCKEDCRGLCPKCGGNLNLIDCKCADDEVDPRWAALQNLN